MQTVPGKLLQQQGIRLGDLNKLLRITTQPINGTTIGENTVAESTSFHRSRGLNSERRRSGEHQLPQSLT